jgi:hypothetical protein
MARNKHRGMAGARFVQLHHYMLKSPAWRSLEALDRAAYLAMAQRHNGQNNGRISFSVRELAEEFRVGKSTACRSLERLSERGFIVPTRKGAFSFKQRHATEWRLTDYDCNGALGTKDFMRWQLAEKSTGSVMGPTGSVAALYGFSGETDVA